MSTCDAGRRAFSSCWTRSLSLPPSPAPPTNGLRLERSSRRLRLPDISSTSEGTGCICGVPGTARLPSSSTRDSAARVLTGASSNLMLLGSRASAPTTGQVWVTAIPARRRGQHAASRASWPNSSSAAELADLWCSSGPPSRVSTSACSLPITLSAPQVSCSWMPPMKTSHMKCPRCPICSSAVDDRRPPTVRRIVRPENRIAGPISAAIRSGDEFPRSRIPDGG
jgi:hypothetical protein